MQRRKIDLVTLKIIKDKIEKGLTNKIIASEINLSYSVVAKITSKVSAGFTDIQILAKTPRRSSRNDATIDRSIYEILIRDPSLTQEGVCKELIFLNINKSQSYIGKKIKKIGFTRKNLVLVPVERNIDRVKTLRFNYARELQSVINEDFVFLDETGFNLHTSASKGYSPINTKAIRTVPASKGVNISLMCAITTKGVLGYKIIDGAYNGQTFTTFINDVLSPYFFNNPSSILVMDNARCHYNHQIITILNEKRIAYKFLPPYTPMLNPIEEVFGIQKSRYKNMRPLTRTRTVLVERIKILLDSFENELSAYFVRAKSFFALALSRQDFV